MSSSAWFKAFKALCLVACATLVAYTCLSTGHPTSSRPEQQDQGWQISSSTSGHHVGAQKCHPESVPKDQRCVYAWSNCTPDSGLLNYLAIYHCIDNTSVASALMLMWLVLLFCLMYVASDAFFCPTLELLSDHLNLTPAVAGATLLAFGNGAPDVMTIVASMHSGAKSGESLSPASISMALSEPLGTGLFVGNIVLGLSILMSRKPQQVAICPYHFFKDIAFYVVALSMVLYCLLVGEVHMWQGVCLVVLYLGYMCMSVWMPREAEKETIAHPELLTLVPHGPWDDISAEELEGYAWKDVLSNEKQQPQSLRVAAHSHSIAGNAGYLQWSKERLSGGKRLGGCASGELVEAGQGSGQQYWLSEDNDHLGQGPSGLGWLPRTVTGRQQQSRRWSAGDAYDSKAEKEFGRQKERCWGADGVLQEGGEPQGLLARESQQQQQQQQDGWLQSHWEGLNIQLGLGPDQHLTHVSSARRSTFHPSSKHSAAMQPAPSCFTGPLLQQQQPSASDTTAFCGASFEGTMVRQHSTASTASCGSCSDGDAGSEVDSLASYSGLPALVPLAGTNNAATYGDSYALRGGLSGARLGSTPPFSSTAGGDLSYENSSAAPLSSSDTIGDGCSGVGSSSAGYKVGGGLSYGYGDIAPFSSYTTKGGLNSGAAGDQSTSTPFSSYAPPDGSLDDGGSGVCVGASAALKPPSGGAPFKPKTARVNVKHNPMPASASSMQPSPALTSRRSVHFSDSAPAREHEGEDGTHAHSAAFKTPLHTHASFSGSSNRQAHRPDLPSGAPAAALRRPMSSFERLESQHATAQQVMGLPQQQQQGRLAPFLGSSALPPISPRRASGVNPTIHTLQKKAPAFSRVGSKSMQARTDGSSRAERASPSVTVPLNARSSVAASSTPGSGDSRSFSMPGAGSGLGGAANRRHSHTGGPYRRHAMHRMTSVSGVIGQDSCGDVSHDGSGMAIPNCGEPSLAQGDLEAAIPLLLEQRFEELKFMLRHTAPNAASSASYFPLTPPLSNPAARVGTAYHVPKADVCRAASSPSIPDHHDQGQRDCPPLQSQSQHHNHQGYPPQHQHLHSPLQHQQHTHHASQAPHLQQHHRVQHLHHHHHRHRPQQEGPGLSRLSPLGQNRTSAEQDRQVEVRVERPSAGAGRAKAASHSHTRPVAAGSAGAGMFRAPSAEQAPNSASNGSKSSSPNSEHEEYAVAAVALSSQQHAAGADRTRRRSWLPWQGSADVHGGGQGSGLANQGRRSSWLPWHRVGAAGGTDARGESEEGCDAAAGGGEGGQQRRESSGAAGTDDGGDMDVQAHLEHEHLRLKKLLLFYQRQRQQRRTTSALGLGLPDIEAPASPANGTIRSRRRRASTYESDHSPNVMNRTACSRLLSAQPHEAQVWADAPAAAMPALLGTHVSHYQQPCNAQGVVHQPQGANQKETLCVVHQQPDVAPQGPPLLSTPALKSFTPHVPALQLPPLRLRQRHEQQQQHHQQQLQLSLHNQHPSFLSTQPPRPPGAADMASSLMPSGYTAPDSDTDREANPFLQSESCINAEGSEIQLACGQQGTDIDETGVSSKGQDELMEMMEDEELMEMASVDETTMEWAEVVKGKVLWYHKHRTRLVWIAWSALQQALIALLSLTMPRVDRSDVPVSPFAFAMAMPLAAPFALAVYWQWWNPFTPTGLLHSARHAANLLHAAGAGVMGIWHTQSAGWTRSSESSVAAAAGTMTYEDPGRKVYGPNNVQGSCAHTRPVPAQDPSTHTQFSASSGSSNASLPAPQQVQLEDLRAVFDEGPGWIGALPDLQLGPAKTAIWLVACVCLCAWLWILVMWPRDGRLRGHVLGVAVIMTFIGAMVWMNAAANELVGLTQAAGQLLGIPIPILEATVLAWGNCVSDLVCNLNLAKDGYPTMAITACFASPIFILLAGVAYVMVYGAHVAEGGVMTMPNDLPTSVLYSTALLNMCLWAVLTPFLFKFCLNKRTAILGFVFYAGFQAVFVTLVVIQQQQPPS